MDMCLCFHVLFFKNPRICEFSDMFKVSPQGTLTKGKKLGGAETNKTQMRIVILVHYFIHSFMYSFNNYF